MVAALARAHGCRRAVTLERRWRGDSDSGTPIAAALGIEVEVRDFESWRRREHAPLPEAEFCACPPGSSVTFAGYEDLLPGALLLGGHYGGTIFSMSPDSERPELRYTGMLGLSGWSANEFLLRVGAIEFPPLFYAWQHFRAIQRISVSPELRPSAVGGDYDRPIARRIAEEAGVPRDAIGRRKIAGGHLRLFELSRLLPDSRADYLEFYRGLELPWTTRWSAHALHRASELCNRCDRSLVPLPRYFVRRSFLPLEASFLFQWGTQRIRARYATQALAAAAPG